MRAIGSELELIINDAPDVSHTKSLAGYSNTNIEFEFNSSNVSLSGKNTELLVNELYAENNGIIVSTMLDSNKELPIRVKGIRSSSDIIGDTNFLSIPSQNGIDFIGNYGEARINKTSSYVTRRNSQRVNHVEGWIWTGTLPHQTELYLEENFKEFERRLPPGYSILVGGEANSRGESQSQIFSSAIIYILLITIGLVFALNSFRQTAVILSVAIFSIGLSFLGLKIGQQNYGFIGTIGALGLIGLSINLSLIHI